MLDRRDCDEVPVELLVGFFLFSPFFFGSREWSDGLMEGDVDLHSRGGVGWDGQSIIL